MAIASFYGLDPAMGIFRLMQRPEPPPRSTRSTRPARIVWRTITTRTFYWATQNGQLNAYNATAGTTSTLNVSGFVSQVNATYANGAFIYASDYSSGPTREYQLDQPGNRDPNFTSSHQSDRAQLR